MIVEIPNRFSYQVVKDDIISGDIVHFFDDDENTPEKLLKTIGIKLLGGNSNFYEAELPEGWNYEDNIIWDFSFRKRLKIFSSNTQYYFTNFCCNFAYFKNGIYAYRSYKKDGILMANCSFEEFLNKFPKYKFLDGNHDSKDVYDALNSYWNETIVF